MDKFANEVRLTVEIVYQKTVKHAKGLLKDFNFKYWNKYYSKNKDMKNYIRGVSFNKKVINTNYNKNEKYLVIAQLGINKYTKNGNQKVFPKLFVEDIVPINNPEMDMTEEEKQALAETYGN